MTVITSDFNLVDDEVRSRSLVRYESITKLFLKGNSFGVYAQVRIKGVIYGLPGGLPHDRALVRPFYVLLIGPIEKIIEFRKLLTAEFSEKKANRREKFFLFTDKLITNRITEQNFEKSDYALNDGAKFSPVLKNMPGIPQFEVPRNSGSVSLNVDLGEVQVPETLPLDKFSTDQSIWMRRSGGGDCSKRWLPVKSANTLAEVERQGTEITMDLFADRASMKKLPTNRAYFFSVNITAASTSLSDTDRNWLKAWSFDAIGLDKLVEKQEPFFPTLNLHRFVETLSAATSNDASGGGAILSFNAVLTRTRR